MSEMSEYKRLISYIYNYEKGIKKNNVGFAKIELRNGQCKFSINIKAASLNGQKLRTYVFYRENKKMIQILLDETSVKNGGFEWKGITNASNIMNTGHSFDQLGGLLLYYSMDKYYATEWDDQPIMLTYLYEWDEVESWKSKVKDTVIEEKDNIKIAEKEILKNDKFQNIEPNKEVNKEVNKEINKEINIEHKPIEIPNDELTYIKQKKEIEDAISKSQEEIVQSILQSIDCGWELFCNGQNDTKTKRDTNTRKQTKEALQGAELAEDSKVISQIDSEIDNSISPETAKLVGYRFINWYRGQETGFPAVAKANASNVEQKLFTADVSELKDTGGEGVEQQDNEAQGDYGAQGDYEVQGDYGIQGDYGVQRDYGIQADYGVQRNYGIQADHEDSVNYEVQADEEQEEVAATVANVEYEKKLFEEEQSFYDTNSEKEWNERLEEVAKRKTSTAERILQKYPAIYPFEDDEIVACVRIEPGDIGLFPIENWVLGNNSFLLHGYYNFRHLIFAKRKVLDGEEFILGVPGVYQNREKFMAKMFGFAQFKASKNVAQKTGEFGYWYLKINM